LKGYLSVGTVITFRSAGKREVYGLYYAPTNAAHRGPSGALPPALIFVHGGPTSMTDAGLKLRTQFYTSRGFAVLDVNYSGSTGLMANGASPRSPIAWPPPNTSPGSGSPTPAGSRFPAAAPAATPP